MKENDIYGLVALFGLFCMAFQYWLSNYSLFPSTILMVGNIFAIGYLVSRLQSKTKLAKESKR